MSTPDPWCAKYVRIARHLAHRFRFDPFMYAVAVFALFGGMRRGCV